MGSRACETVASEWLSVADAADELGVTARTAYRWIEKGWLPAYRFRHVPRGRVVGVPRVFLRVKRADIERLLAEGLPA